MSKPEMVADPSLTHLPPGFIAPTPEAPEVLTAILPEESFNAIHPKNKEEYRPLCFSETGKYIGRPVEVRYGKFLYRGEIHVVELRVPGTDKWLLMPWGNRDLTQVRLSMSDEVKEALIAQIPDYDLQDAVKFTHFARKAQKAFDDDLAG